MPANYPPFMFAYGVLAEIVARIQDRAPPEVFTHDFLRFTLGFSRESDRAFLPLAKRVGLVAVDGKPTDLYHRLRDPAQARAAIAEAMREGYPTLYARHPDLTQLDRKALAGLVAEITGLPAGHASARAIVGTVLALQAMAAPPALVPRAEDRRKTVERRQAR